MRKNSIKFFLYLPLVGLLEAPFALAFFGYPRLLSSNLGPSLFAHAVAVALCFFSFPKAWGWNASFFLLFLPFFGWILMLFLYFSPLSSTRTRTQEESFVRGEKEERTFDFPSGRRKERIAKELDLMPLSEILLGDDLAMKRGAIEQLVVIKTPEVIQLLHQYRTDPSVDIRFFVTNALSRIKKEYEEQLAAAKEEMKKDIYDIPKRSFLAKSYLLYARSGLSDETMKRSYEGEALYHLQFSAQDEQAPEEIFWMLIDLYRSHKDWDHVLQLCELLEQRGGQIREEILLAKVETLFQLHRFRDLVSLLQRARQKNIPLNSRFQSILHWWGAWA